MPKMQVHVASVRLSAHASESRCKQGTITLDTDLAGNPQALNPADLLLAAPSACSEPDRRLGLLHENVKKYGTVPNTVAPGIELAGVLQRKIKPQ